MRRTARDLPLSVAPAFLRWAASGRTVPAAPLPWRNERLAMRDNALDTVRRGRPRWRDNDDVLQRAPGRGPVCARTLRLELPAVGTLTRPQIAAWVGVAPLNGARGTLRGRRMHVATTALLLSRCRSGDAVISHKMVAETNVVGACADKSSIPFSLRTARF